MVERLYREAAVERAMKVQEVIMRAMAKQITWWQAAQILGVRTRTIRRRSGECQKNGIRWFVRPPMETAKSEAGASEGTEEDLGTVCRSIRILVCVTFTRSWAKSMESITAIRG